MKLSDQKKGTLLAFIGIMFITPDSLLIRLANVESWSLIFYRGFIPFFVVFVGLLIIKRNKFFHSIIENGWHGLGYICTFIVTNILFVHSIENTTVANTLIMVSLAPMLSALVSFVFLKEVPDKKTWAAITVTTLAVIYIFIDSFEKGDVKGNLFGFICALGLAAGAVIIRAGKKNANLIPSAMTAKLIIALIALFFVDDLTIKGKDYLIIPVMCVFCVAIPFVLITLAPRYITAAEVNLFFLLEVVLGPLWVWFVIKEQPSQETIIGGAIIILAIATHSFLALKKT